MTSNEAVQKRVQELCKQNGMSADDLSRASNVPACTLNDILDGRSETILIDTVDMLCAGLGVSIAEFFVSPVFLNLKE